MRPSPFPSENAVFFKEWPPYVCPPQPHDPPSLGLPVSPLPMTSLTATCRLLKTKSYRQWRVATSRRGGGRWKGYVLWADIINLLNESVPPSQSQLIVLTGRLPLHTSISRVGQLPAHAMSRGNVPSLLSACVPNMNTMSSVVQSLVSINGYHRKTYQIP